MAFRNFKPNDAGFREMRLGPEIREALAEVAEKAKGIAEGLAQDFRVTGDYADSFEVVAATQLDFGRDNPGPAAVAQLVNTSNHAVAVEYGYHGRSQGEDATSAHRVLGRTLDQLKDT